MATEIEFDLEQNVSIVVPPDGVYVEDENYNLIESPTAQQVIKCLQDEYHGDKLRAVSTWLGSEDFDLHITVRHDDGRITRATW